MYSPGIRRLPQPSSVGQHSAGPPAANLSTGSSLKFKAPLFVALLLLLLLLLLLMLMLLAPQLLGLDVTKSEIAAMLDEVDEDGSGECDSAQTQLRLSSLSQLRVSADSAQTQLRLSPYSDSAQTQLRLGSDSALPLSSSADRPPTSS